MIRLNSTYPYQIYKFQPYMRFFFKKNQSKAFILMNVDFHPFTSSSYYAEGQNPINAADGKILYSVCKQNLRIV